MEQIYSQVDPTVLLHQINRLDDIVKGTTDLSDPKEFLQIRALRVGAGRAFDPHKHIWKNGGEKMITQESWIVIKGRIRGVFYDTDDQVVKEVILNPGDCAITFRGGHSFTSLEDDTILYEIKSGPYQGRENDKVDI